MKSVVPDSTNGGGEDMIERQYGKLGMKEMKPLAVKSAEFLELQEYLHKLIRPCHPIRFSVQDIFRIERQGEAEHFEKSRHGWLRNSDRRLLWHGSGCSNFAGILRGGLCIAPPEVLTTMFGKGVYFADMPSQICQLLHGFF